MAAGPVQRFVVPRLQGPRFVGRRREAADLRSVIDAAMEGRGSLTLVCGEPGIGKTALTEEVARTARERGALVRWATCWEGEGQPPFWAWLQVVRAELGRASRRSAPPGKGLAELLLAGPPSADAEVARFELFDALSGFLLEAATAAPRMIVLDDLQWADASSLSFLLFVARMLPQAPLAVIATCRDVDVDPTSPLLEVFADLCRVARVVSLAGLDDEEIADLLRATGAADPAVVADVRLQSGGNPLFASELARLAVGEPPGAERVGRAVPLGLREVIGQRVARFDQATLSLLEAASVLGQEFATAELASMCGDPEPTVRERLASPLTARLLVEDPRVRNRGLRFAHDLVRRTLYDRLGPANRAELHRRAADAIVRTGAGSADEHLSRIAAHRVEAVLLGGRAAAVTACRAAAEHARLALAHEEAAALLRTAVRLADEDPAAAGNESAALLADLADAEWQAGRADAAVDAAQRGLLAARRAGDAVVFARSAVDCGLGTAVFDRRPDLIALLDEALERLGDAHHELAARVLARKVFALVAVRPRDIEAVSGRALEAARRSGDDRALADALQARHGATWGAGTMSERRAIVAELGDIAARTGDRDLAIEAALLRLVGAMDRGDGDGVTAALAEVTTIAEALRRPRWRFYASSRQAAVALIRGDHDAAELAIEATTAAAGQVAEMVRVVHVLRFWLAVQRGDTTLPELTNDMLAFYDQLPLVRSYGGQAALGLVITGHEEQARAVVHRLLDQLAESESPAVWSTLPGTMLLAEVCVRLRMAEPLPVLYQALLPHEASVGTIAAAIGAVGPVAYSLGRLAAADGRPQAAAAHFELALATAERMRSRPWEAQTKIAWADVLARSGDSRGAARLRTKARRIAEELGLAQVLAALGGPSPPPPAHTDLTDARLRLDGDHWQVTLGPQVSRLRDAKGLRHLADLLAHPDVERHVFDLVALTEGATGPGLDRHRLGDAGVLLDPAAKAAYKRRLEDLREDVAEAEAFNDYERATRARAEIDAFVQELSRAVGLGGRDRRAASAVERARLNVTRAIRSAITRVEAVLPPLGDHLDRCVRTSVFCSYQPDGQLRVRVEAAKPEIPFGPERMFTAD